MQLTTETTKRHALHLTALELVDLINGDSTLAALADDSAIDLPELNLPTRLRIPANATFYTQRTTTDEGLSEDDTVVTVRWADAPVLS